MPPPPAELVRLTFGLLAKQKRLQLPEEAGRRAEILRERDLELSGYLRPLGIEDTAGYPHTITLLLIIARLCEEIGMRYKDRYDAPRPSIVNPRLRTFIANPLHASYPSNHSFQSYSMAFVFARVVPEHPGLVDLFLSCRRIAENREWAGVHYPTDTAAGRLLARMMTPVFEVVLEEQMLLARSEWT